MTDQRPSRGWQGAVLKMLRAGDYELTVTGRRQVTADYLRLSFTGGGLLTDRDPHPTMWIRLWFSDGTKLHQRGYTLVDPNPADDTVDIEFALHEGLASCWAEAAQPGDTIEATVMGSNFTIPDPAPAGWVIVGDSASLPAINSLLAAIGDDAKAQVFLESSHDSDRDLPVCRDAAVMWIDRKNSGEALVQAVAEAAFDASDHFGWVACDNRTTRAVAKLFREQYGMQKKQVKAQAYWVA